MGVNLVPFLNSKKEILVPEQHKAKGEVLHA